jgi:hypothetical protein
MQVSLRSQICALGVLSSLGFASPAVADYIPLTDSFVELEESVLSTSADDSGTVSASFSGSDLQLPDRVSASATAVEGGASGTASGFAETRIGSAGTGIGPSATVSTQYVTVGESGFASVTGVARITYGAQVLKLHPDAPDDALFPLLFSGSLTNADSILSVENGRTDEVFSFRNSSAGVRPIDASLLVSPGDRIEAGVVAGSSAESVVTTVSGPVFSLDPGTLVPFIPNPDGSQRFVSVADLFTLAYPEAIGFAGNFTTATPLNDGCLPDPTILAPSGLPSVRDGDVVTCQAIDPSGYRSYGQNSLLPSGRLNWIDIVIPDTATVKTDLDQTETIGLLGSNNDVINEGTIVATGDGSTAILLAVGNANTISNLGSIETTGVQSLAIDLAGNELEVQNEGQISTKGDLSAAIFIEGDDSAVANLGDGSSINTEGLRSSAAVIEGDRAINLNEGTISTTGNQSSGLVVEGLAAFMENSGAISTTGTYSVGMTMLSIDSQRLRNTGDIETQGADAMGILALGLNHDIENLDLTTTSEIEGQIMTRGIRAFGIALGLQEPVLPPGVEIPPGALAAASGSVTSSGRIETRGNEADAIHAFANNLPVTNSGDLKTSGEDAHGISIIGELATAINEADGTITVEGDESFAIDIVGAADEITLISNAGSLTGGIEGPGGASPTINAGAIRLIGVGKITNEADSALAAFGEAAVGIFNTAGDGSSVENLGEIRVDSSVSLKAGRGIDVVGNNLRLQNGAQQASSVADDASLEIIGDNSVGMRTAGTGAVVSNSTILSLDGNNNKGIEVEIQGSGNYWIDNDGAIELGDGTGNIAIHVRSANLGSNIVLPTASNSDAFCVGGGPTGAQVLNCGAIRLGASNAGLGVFVEGVAESFIENQASISGTGDNQVAIIVRKGIAADPGDAQLNAITNFTDINLGGAGARGILVEGSGNYVFNGTGVSRFDYLGVSRFDDSLDGLGGSISQALDTQSARTGAHGPNDEEQSVTSLGDIRLTGPNAIGIDINGIGNLIGNRSDRIDSEGTIDPRLPPDQQPEGPPGFSEILASGAGSIGVRFGGSGNIIDNEGIISGDAYSILGGGGSDIVQNKNRLVGDVDLGGGSDTFIQLGTGNNIEGTVEAGEGGGLDDLLFLASTAPLAAEQSGAVDRFDLDGNKFRNFEGLKINNGDLEKLKPGAIDLPQGRVYLQNSLILDALDSGGVLISQAEITDAAVYFENGARLEADEILVGLGGALRGNGSAGRRVIAIGQVASTIVVDPGGLIGPGNSAGEFELFGDVEFGGTLEIEIFGTGDGQFDVLRVLGDLNLLGTASLEIMFSGGFAPKAGDSFDFLSADNLLGDIDPLNVALFGLLPGFEYELAFGQAGVALVALTDGVVPLPPAVWLFLSGLGSLAGWSRWRLRRPGLPSIAA